MPSQQQILNTLRTYKPWRSPHQPGEVPATSPTSPLKHSDLRLGMLVQLNCSLNHETRWWIDGTIVQIDECQDPVVVGTLYSCVVRLSTNTLERVLSNDGHYQRLRKPL